jgi:hypothetical protein
MAKLHQVIALERGVESESERELKQVQVIIGVGGDKDPLTGTEKTYETVVEGGDEFPPVSRKVQVTVPDLLEVVQTALTRLFDVKYTREYANTFAVADVVVDGEVLLERVPAGYLLFLETQIGKLVSGLVDRLPVLSATADWEDDPALPRGVRRAAPHKTHRAARVKQVHVLAKNEVVDGKPFPGKFEPYETEKVVGYWTEVKTSGQLYVRDVQAMHRRGVQLLQAVRFAREEANTADVEEKHAGEAVLGYIFGTTAAAAGE